MILRNPMCTSFVFSPTPVNREAWDMIWSSMFNVVRMQMNMHEAYALVNAKKPGLK
jgi:hypothetical protein